jgi:hypothetical protein
MERAQGGRGGMLPNTVSLRSWTAARKDVVVRGGRGGLVRLGGWRAAVRLTGWGVGAIGTEVGGEQ